MHNIGLICTQHVEQGKCNSTELLSVIERIKPDVIFEELTERQWGEFYMAKSRISLETNAIRMYLQDNVVEHIPVDTYERTNRYDDDRDWVYEKLLNSTHLAETRDLRMLWDEISSHASQQGFAYLNSEQHGEALKQSKAIEESIIVALKSESLSRRYRSVMEVNENREHAIIENVYKYSQQNIYQQAILQVGSGHRKPIIDKIEKYQESAAIKLNWSFVF
jgi:hypothetical protein